MQQAYSFLGNEDFVDMIRDAFAQTLEKRGYHLQVIGAGPGSPHIYEYRREQTIVAVKVDDTAGEKWEAELSVETEGPREELEAIVSGSVTGLLAELSTRLLESVVDESCRSAVAKQLGRVLAEME